MLANYAPAMEKHQGHVRLSIQTSPCIALRLNQMRPLSLALLFVCTPSHQKESMGPRKCALFLDYPLGTQDLENSCADSTEAVLPGPCMSIGRPPVLHTWAGG